LPKDVRIQIEAEDFTPVPNSLNSVNPLIADYTNNPGKENFGVRHASEGKWTDYGRMYSSDADNSDPRDEGYFEFTLPAGFPGNTYIVQFRYGCNDSFPSSTKLALQVKKQDGAGYGEPFISKPLFPNGKSNGTIWFFDVKLWFSSLMDRGNPDLTGKLEIGGGDTLKLYTLDGRAIVDYLVFIPSKN
jgi:hypothetical protein